MIVAVTSGAGAGAAASSRAAWAAMERRGAEARHAAASRGGRVQTLQGFGRGGKEPALSDCVRVLGG